MLRLRSNCKVILVELSELDELISVTPAMRPSDRSSGVATVAAIVSGLAPGSVACTEIVGKSTCGKAATGSNVNAITPDNTIPSANSVVATGRFMKISERFMATRPSYISGTVGSWGRFEALRPLIKGKVNNRRCKQSQYLAYQQSSHHRDTQRMAQFRPDAGTEH